MYSSTPYLIIVHLCLFFIKQTLDPLIVQQSVNVKIFEQNSQILNQMSILFERFTMPTNRLPNAIGNKRLLL